MAEIGVVPYFNHIIQIMETNKDLRATAMGILKQVSWAAGGACVGGVVGGPLGALFGTVVGGTIGYLQSDEYTSLISVLKTMGYEDKQKIVGKVKEMVAETDLEEFICSPTNQTRFIQCLVDATGAK